MNNIKAFLIFFFSLLTISTVKSNDSASYNYMPLAIGNKWLYLNTTTGAGPSRQYYVMSEVRKDTVVYGYKYFYCTKFLGSYESIWLRLDTTQMILYQLDTSQIRYCGKEIPLFDFSSSVGDSFYSCNDYKHRFLGSSDTIIFGEQTILRAYSYYHTYGHCISSKSWQFLKDLGPLYSSTYSFCRLGVGSNYRLLGCYINGQLYGDTLYTVPNPYIPMSNPETYYLQQNYPNPFNPRTKIQFSVPSSQFVVIKIFDVTGREVATLVNEELKPGTYEVDWDGSNNASGIYYYRIAIHSDELESSDYTETKKMVLLK